MYFTGYQIFIWFGVGIKDLEKRNLSLLTIGLLLMSISLLFYRIAINKADILSLNFKTPPYLDYQIYGMAVASLLWRMKDLLIPIAYFKFMKFIGQNTIWLYFWHIPIVITMKSLLVNFHWGIVFIITFILSCVMYYIQFISVKKIDNIFFNKYLIG